MSIKTYSKWNNAFENATVLRIEAHFLMPVLRINIIWILTLCKGHLRKPNVLVSIAIYQYFNRVPDFKSARIVTIGHVRNSHRAQSTIGATEGQNDEGILWVVCKG
jgi:hypothetical protein